MLLPSHPEGKPAWLESDWVVSGINSIVLAPQEAFVCETFCFQNRLITPPPMLILLFPEV